MMGPYENGGSNLLVHNHFIQPTILVYTQLLDNTHIYQVPGCQSYPPLWAPLNHRFWSVNPHDSSGIYHQMPNFIPYLIRVVYPSWLAGQSLIEFDDCPARKLLGFPAGKLGSIPLSRSLHRSYHHFWWLIFMKYPHYILGFIPITYHIPFRSRFLRLDVSSQLGDWLPNRSVKLATAISAARRFPLVFWVLVFFAWTLRSLGGSWNGGSPSFIHL